MLRIVCVWCVVVGIAGAAPVAQSTQTVRVAAAADLKFALDEAIARFAAQEPSIQVRPTYGSSGNMHT